MASVTYAGATRRYQRGEPAAVDALDLDVADGEFVVLVGPSGSGKSTALRMLAGLEAVDEGSVSIGDVDVARTPARDRDIAMVFQNYALYPHMTVEENMGFALKLRGVTKSDRRVRVRRAAEMLELDRFLDRRPDALSGGQRQRVAMGRAIVREPSVFLMDEPLSSLDAKLRAETRANIAELHATLGTTTLYVTHDQVEAMTLGDRVAVLRDGTLQQVASPREIYDRPATAFVAEFMGSPPMNLWIGEDADGPVTMGVRPESVRVTTDVDGVDLDVTAVEQLGADGYVFGRTAAPTVNRKPFAVRVPGRDLPPIGTGLRVAWDDSDIHLFDPQTGRRLPGR